MREPGGIAADVVVGDGSEIDPCVRRVMSHCRVEVDYLAALRHFIRHLLDGYATFRGGLSRARRRELIHQVFACHRENRERARTCGWGPARSEFLWQTSRS